MDAKTTYFARGLSGAACTQSAARIRLGRRLGGKGARAIGADHGVGLQTRVLGR